MHKKQSNHQLSPLGHCLVLFHDGIQLLSDKGRGSVTMEGYRDPVLTLTALYCMQNWHWSHAESLFTLPWSQQTS